MKHILRSLLRFVGFALIVTGCLSAAVSITVTSNPSRQVFTVDGGGCAGGGYTTPQTLSWTPGSSCTLNFVSPHSVQVGTQYSFSIWQDGVTANPRVIAAPSSPTTYTGNF